MELKRYLNKNHIITAVISYKQFVRDYMVKENCNEKNGIPIGELVVVDKWRDEKLLDRFLEMHNRDLCIYNISCRSKGIYIYDKEFCKDFISMKPFIAILFPNNISYVHAFNSDEELDKWMSKMGLDKFLNSKDIFCPDDI